MENLNHVKNVLALPLAIYVAYDLSAADGKIDLGDLPNAMGVVTKLPAFASSIPHAVPAFKAVSEDESQFSNLKAWVSDEFDIADDEVEAKVEQGVKLALELGRFIVGFSADESDDASA